MAIIRGSQTIPIRMEGNVSHEATKGGYMLPIKKNSFLSTMEGEFDKIWNDFFKPNFPTIRGTIFQDRAFPKWNILDLPDKIKFIVAIPGYAKENIDIEIKNDILTIKGGKSDRSKEFEKEDYIQREVSLSSFSRSISLYSSELKIDEISAEFKDSGILEIVIPKKETVKEESKKIEIK